MTSTFDPQRAILLTEPEPEPFRMGSMIPLSDGLKQGIVPAQAPYLVAQIGDSVMLLPMLAMVYHHVVQGTLGGVPWMAAFCCLCNSGTVFNPQVDGKVHTFAAQGFYDVMVLLADQETQSYWNHLTGKCLHGTHEGAALERIGSLVQMRAAEALTLHPDAQVVLAEHMTAEETATAERWNSVYRLPEVPKYNEGLLATTVHEDTRLPRHDMGLGIWTAHTQRYYGIHSIYQGQNVLLDDVDGRQVVIVYNEAIGLPRAFYFDTTRIEQRGDEWLLAPNAVYRGGILYVDGKPTKPQAPNHNAIRWYAFASIFPNCEIHRSEPVKA